MSVWHLSLYDVNT